MRHTDDEKRELINKFIGELELMTRESDGRIRTVKIDIGPYPRATITRVDSIDLSERSR